METLYYKHIKNLQQYVIFDTKTWKNQTLVTLVAVCVSATTPW
jgi:hypothetical protein